MKNYKYLIIGAGMTADAAAKGIREMDSGGTIGMIGDETDPPYKRPPLSKGLWKGKPVETIWLKTEDLHVDFFGGRKVTSIDPKAKTVLDDQGESYSYEKLLLATGVRPREFPFGGKDINYLRTFQDYQRLMEFSSQHNEFGVIGGGFIGSEITAALSRKGKRVTMLFPEEGIGSRLFPKDLALSLNDFYRSKGVEVLSGVNLINGQQMKDSFHLAHDQGGLIRVDGVVAGIGTIPNNELAKASGIETKNGILVDDFLMTNITDVYAAGDGAEFNQPELGIRRRVEHEDNAKIMGKQVGRNMADAHEPYRHLPYFYSDLFELGYEAVGELDPRLETFSDWQEPFKKGVVYYLSNGKVRGVLLWNVWDSIDKARELVSQSGLVNASDLKNRIT